MLTLILMVIAVSLDCWGTGLAYGLQNICVTKTAVGLIGLASAGVFGLAMGVGGLLGSLIAPEIMGILGAVLVIALGIYSLMRSSVLTIEKEKRLLKIAAGKIGILLKIRHNTKEADLDRSGVISGKEACYLGLALSLDAFGVGISAALMELDWVISSLAVGSGAAVSLALGLYLGEKLGQKIGYEKMRALPGLILIATGIGRLLSR